jgi:SSS family solute:Na+ symporter
MSITAFIIFLFGLQAICLIVGTKSSQKVKNKEDYFLAGKSIRFFPLMMTFLATQVGGGLVLGSAEEAYRYGWAVLLYPIGAAAGLLLLGAGLGRKLAQFKVSTVAQIFEVIYQSKMLKKMASVLSIISLFMILVAQVIASSKFMASIGVENIFWFLGFWAIVIFYTSLGGLKAVVSTDVVQASFFIGAFFLCFGFIYFSSDIMASHVIEMGMSSNSLDLNSSKFLGWLLMPLMFMVIEQDMAQRCLAADAPKTVSKATLWAGLATIIISVIPVYLGVLAKGMGLEVSENKSILMAVIEINSTPILTALVGCAIIVAIISTADSLINAISSNVSLDFELKCLKKDNIILSQLLTALIAVLALFCSFYFNNVVDLLILSYELSVSCIFVPIFAALFKPKGNLLSAVLSILFGALGFVIFRIVQVDFPKELLSIFMSIMGFGLGELIQLMNWQPKKISGLS